MGRGSHARRGRQAQDCEPHQFSPVQRAAHLVPPARILRIWLWALSVLLAAWLSADNSGSILLTVTGPGGAAMAGAAVAVASRSLIAPRTAAADARGKVLLAGLLPGRYRVRVSRPGYETAEREIGLVQDQAVELVIPLRVETVRETVVVSEPLPTVDTRSATVAAHITAEEVEAIPEPYMYGPLPGTIEHQVKAFGSYRTPWNVELGALIYWNSGAVFTESDIFRPGSYDIYYNHRLPDGSYVRAGTERQPAYATVDLRFGDTIPVRRAGRVRLILDVMNALNNQGPIRIEEAHNSPDFAYRAPRLLLAPRRYQLGVKFTW